MNTGSIIAIKDRLFQVERRLAVAKRRNSHHPEVIHLLSREAAVLREEMWAIRRERLTRNRNTVESFR